MIRNGSASFGGIFVKVGPNSCVVDQTERRETVVLCLGLCATDALAPRCSGTAGG